MIASSTIIPTRSKTVTLSVPTIRCGACIATIERNLAELADVQSARANLTLRRVQLQLAERSDTVLEAVLKRLAEVGHPATPIDATELESEQRDEADTALLRAVAVAGFGAMNVMLLSVSVWAGAEGAMRHGFHWISALITVPVVAYSGRFFFASAWSALRSARMNMDVPIALALILALALSLVETLRGAEHVFFDAVITLTFFLLIGRYLDHRMRGKARNALTVLSKLVVKDALRVLPNGQTLVIAAAEITPGMVLRIPAGERMPVDVRILSGATDLDRSIVSGEADAVAATAGDEIEAGALNLTGPVEAVALRPVQESFVADMTRMLGSAETGRGRHVRIADRIARVYAPMIHLVAGATFLGWCLATGDWLTSAFVAISVLIITCPCAMSLAVPVAHVVAAGRLMRDGIMMKDGSALERLAQIDCATFDKTGTLTQGGEMRQMPETLAEGPMSVLAELASSSRHPAALAIAKGLPQRFGHLYSVTEVPGHGIEGGLPDGRRARLGRASWVGDVTADRVEGSGPAFGLEGAPMSRIALSETLRSDARSALSELTHLGIATEILSGDDEERVALVADRLGGIDYRHGLTPAQKVARLETLEAEGHRVLMVGDGLNDTPALAAAYVSMSPASATDAGRAAADFVFLRDSLAAVPNALGLARRTARIVRQNFGLAVLYNAVAIPIAIAGHVTPLMAAIAMSLSSILVVANSLRLNGTPLPCPRLLTWRDSEKAQV